MNIRALEVSDVERLRVIHEKYFSEEFPFPDFLNGYICACVIEKDNKIICAGGVRSISELIAITDKSQMPRDRVRGLKKLLEASIYFSTKTGHDHLHTFSQGDIWINQLTKAGFMPCKGTALYI